MLTHCKLRRDESGSEYKYSRWRTSSLCSLPSQHASPRLASPLSANNFSWFMLALARIARTSLAPRLIARTMATEAAPAAAKCPFSHGSMKIVEATGGY